MCMRRPEDSLNAMFGMIKLAWPAYTPTLPAVAASACMQEEAVIRLHSSMCRRVLHFLQFCKERMGNQHFRRTTEQ